jgi:uncharacterized membrane protein
MADALTHGGGAGMEQVLRGFAGNIALATQLISVLAVAVGAIVTLANITVTLAQRKGMGPPIRRRIFIGFAGWIILALEFALAADIARTAIAPTWDDIGQLAAIAAIRTVLNYFLERDVEDRDSQAS